MRRGSQEECLARASVSIIHDLSEIKEHKRMCIVYGVNSFIDMESYRLREGGKSSRKAAGKKKKILRQAIVGNLTASLVSSAFEFLLNTDRRIAFRGHEEGSWEVFSFRLALGNYRRT